MGGGGGATGVGGAGGNPGEDTGAFGTDGGGGAVVGTGGAAVLGACGGELFGGAFSCIFAAEGDLWGNRAGNTPGIGGALAGGCEITL